MWASCTSSTIRSRYVRILEPLLTVFACMLNHVTMQSCEFLHHGTVCISMWAFQPMSMLRRATIRHGEQIRWGPILEASLEAACMGHARPPV